MTDEEKRNAVAEHDAASDGRFYYAVRSTGIYCRPSCRSKRPNPENLLFFDTAAEAERAGYRPCKRCRPDLLNYQPVRDLAEQMKKIIDTGFMDKTRVFEKLKTLGVTPKRAIEVFKAQFGQRPSEYADRLRISDAMHQLRETDTPMIEIACALGFESLSAFYAFFGKYAGRTPGEYRRDCAAAPEGTSCAYDTGFGRVVITADRDAVTGVRFGETGDAPAYGENELTMLVAQQLRAYFAGLRTDFTVPLRPEGSEFQRLVWSALREIPYGQTRSYKQIAERIGRPGASRAVGMANNKNPILILIPCHRVVGSDGALVGYAAGLALKQRLLALETAGGD